MFQIIGMREEYYIGNVFYSVEMHKPEQLKKYILSVLQNNKKYEIELRIDHSVCLNGWSIVSYGIMKVTPVKRFIITHNLRDSYTGIVETPLPLQNIYKFRCTYFSVSYTGMTAYPEGYIFVNRDCFIKTSKQKNKRPVFLMYGEYPISFSNDYQNVENLPQKNILKQILIFNTQRVFNLIPFIEQTKEYIVGNNEYIYVNFLLLRRSKNNYIWILYGNSNLGKRYLTRNSNSVYYTNENSVLPDTIKETFIVINSTVLLNDIINRIHPVKTIIGVHFTTEFPTFVLYQQKKEILNEITSEVSYRPFKKGYYDAMEDFYLNCAKQKT
jgi:hypothetical protein